jgi:hypothetical protein
VKKLIAVTALASSVFLASTSAFANSCSQQGAACKAWANGQGAQAASYRSACAGEVGRCISRCKQGQKFFVGVSNGPGGGQQYPIDGCK